MLPLIAPESLTCPFKFYFDGQIREGMTYHQEFYKLLKSFPGHQRDVAYEMGCYLSDQGDRVVITVAPDSSCYQIWIDVRSQASLPELTSSVDQVAFFQQHRSRRQAGQAA